MRMPVSVVVAMLPEGTTASESLAEHPDLAREDVRDALLRGRASTELATCRIGIQISAAQKETQERLFRSFSKVTASPRSPVSDAPPGAPPNWLGSGREKRK
jgi:hypothetical protein